MEFCNNNDLQLIVRAHECVMDGFERFAQGHLITLFSATNYCGKDLFLGYLQFVFGMFFGTAYYSEKSFNKLDVWLKILALGCVGS